MNNSIVVSATPQLSSVRVYEAFQSTNGKRMPSGPVFKPSSSWRRFIHKSIRGVVTESTITSVPAAKATAGGLTVLRSVTSTPTSEELLNSPLFQVAGIFAIGVPDWADKHDEYLAEAYLENHAESK